MFTFRCHPRTRKYAFYLAGLTLAFSLPLWHLVQFVRGNDLFSYILLIPAICAYLAYLERDQLPEQSPPWKGLAALFGVAGAAAIVAWGAYHPNMLREDSTRTTLIRAQVVDPAGLQAKLRQGGTPLASYLWQRFSALDKTALEKNGAADEAGAQLLLGQLNQIIQGTSLFSASRFEGIQLRERTQALLASPPDDTRSRLANRLLLEDAFPDEIAPSLWRTADVLSGVVLAYVLLAWAGAGLCLGQSWLRRLWFPLAMLVFLIPIPTAALDGLEITSQRYSADTTQLFLDLAGATYARSGQVFDLPTMPIQVAKECSGVRSSLVLFITSLIAGHLFLRGATARVILATFVIPLGLMRNGFRIFTISQLCVHVDPRMIDSYIHHRGGPIFFAFSLIPFFGMLLGLRAWEKWRESASATALRRPESGGPEVAAGPAEVRQPEEGQR